MYVIEPSGPVGKEGPNGGEECARNLVSELERGFVLDNTEIKYRDPAVLDSINLLVKSAQELVISMVVNQSSYPTQCPSSCHAKKQRRFSELDSLHGINLGFPVLPGQSATPNSILHIPQHRLLTSSMPNA